MKQTQYQNSHNMGPLGVLGIALLLNGAVGLGVNAQSTIMVDGYQNDVQFSPSTLSFVEVPDYATKELGNSWDFAESECDMLSVPPAYVGDLSLSEGVSSIDCPLGSVSLSPSTSCTSGCSPMTAYLLFGGDASFRLAPVLRSSFVLGFRDTPKSGRQFPIDADAYSLLSLKSNIADYNSPFKVKWLLESGVGGPLLSDGSVSSLELTSKTSPLMGPDNVLLLDLKNPSASNFNVLSSNNADWRGKVVSFGFEKGDGASAANLNFDWVRLVKNGPPYITLSWTHTLSDGTYPLTSDTAINEYLSEVNVQIKTYQVGGSTNFSVIKEMTGDVACVEGNVVPGQRVCKAVLPVALFPAGEYRLAIEMKKSNVYLIFLGEVGLNIAPYADQPKIQILSPAVAGSEVSIDTTYANTSAIPRRLSDSDSIWNMDNIRDDGTLDLFNNVTDSVRTVFPGTQGVFRDILGMTSFDIDVGANATSGSANDADTTSGDPFSNSLNFLLGTNYWKPILSSNHRYLTVAVAIDDDLGSNFLNLAERFGRGYSISPAYHNRSELMAGLDRYQSLYPGRRVYTFDLWDSSTSHIGRRWRSSTWLNLLLSVRKAAGISGASLDFVRLTRNCVLSDGSCPLTLRLQNATAAMDADVYIYKGGFSDTSPTLLGRVTLPPNEAQGIDLRTLESSRIPANIDSFFEIRLLSSDGVSAIDSFRSDIPVHPVSVSPDRRKTLVDFDGDGRSDEFIYRRNTATQTGLYYQRLSSTTRPVYRKWIEAGDAGKYSPVTGDFDGDAKADVSLIFPENGELIWYVYLSGSGKVFGKAWGRVGDIVVVGDAMGSVGDEMGIYRTTSEGKGQWAFYDLRTGKTALWEGLAGIPVAGDYNGDGKIEQGVIAAEGRKLVWKTLKKGAKKTTPLKKRYQTRILGAVGDIPVVGDWNGDGKSDKAIYRASTGSWYIMTDEAAGSFMTVKWGGASYLPVVGDYNGDGVIEPTVYNKSTGVWFHRYHNDEWHKVKLGKGGDFLSCNGRVVTVAGCQ